MRFENSSNYKQRVKESFDRAAQSYDHHASIQRKAAGLLFDFALPYFPFEPKFLLEIGCGTGFLSEKIAKKWPSHFLTLVDIAPAMIEICRKKMGQSRHRYLVGDGESDSFPNAPFDLIFSNLTFQWFSNLQKAIHHLLSQTHALAFSTLLSGSFKEWKKIDSSLENSYPTAEKLQALCNNQEKFRSHFIFSEELQDFSSPLAWMAHLKNIGANISSSHHPPRSFHSRFKHASEGITINYRIAYCVMVKR